METRSRKIFVVFNTIFLSLIACMCFLPVLHIFMVSLSSGSAADAGLVKFWPVDFTLGAYEYVIAKKELYQAFMVSFMRVGLAIATVMSLTILIAYPLSRSEQEFKYRNFYMWFFVITMLFHGGLIPTYILVKKIGLVDNIWALILPISLPVYNILLLYKFFNSIPREIEESAFIDGAGYFTTLIRIMLPLSKPVLATLVLFVAVQHWNAWFDGIIYMNSPQKYPLQSFLQTVVIQRDINLSAMANLESTNDVSQRSNMAAQIFVAMVPILCVYPLLQKHFTKGILLGSVKG